MNSNSHNNKLFADGGFVGQEITIDLMGDEKQGVIKEITDTGDYIVTTNDGRTVLAEEQDVIELGQMRKKELEQSRKKIFGLFEDGGDLGSEPRLLKGYLVSIFRSDYDSPSNNILYGKNSAILVTDGKKGDSSTVMSNEPYLKLVKRELFGKTVLSAEPVNYGYEGKWKMFGGTFVWSTDSRFRQDISEQPIQLHDRVEFSKGGSTQSTYKIFEGYDHFNSRPLYKVVGVDNEYEGEWHLNKLSAAKELRNLTKKRFEDGGNIAKGNNEMLHSQAKEAKHHIEELDRILNSSTEVEPWVLAKMTRAKTDLSDITHYLDGSSKKMSQGGKIEGYEDLSSVKPNLIKISETSAFGNPDKLILNYNGKKIAQFYYNMRGYNSDFSLKNSDGVHYGFGGDKSKTRQISDFKKALKEGFVFIKNYSFEEGGKIISSKKTSSAQQAKIGKVMHEFKAGKLHSGSKRGPIVRKRKQALAIALAEANASRKMLKGGSVDENIESKILSNEENSNLKEFLKHPIFNKFKEIVTFSSGGGYNHTMILLSNGHIVTVNWESGDVQYSYYTYKSIEEYLEEPKDDEKGWDNEFDRPELKEGFPNYSDLDDKEFLDRMMSSKMATGGSVSDFSNQTGLKSTLLSDSSFTNLLFPFEKSFIATSETKIFKKGTALYITDGKREIVIGSTKPFTKIKKLGNASANVKEAYSNASKKMSTGGKVGKFKVGDTVSYSDGMNTFEGKITHDYTDEKFYVGDKYGYSVTGFGDRLRPEQLTLVKSASVTKGMTGWKHKK